MLSSEITKGKDGVDRCNRTIMIAVENVKGDVSKGYHNIQAYCGMPIVTRISDNVKGCPRCDKEPPVGNVHPRTTNAASIALTPAELKECGLTEDTSLKEPELKKAVKKPREKKAVEAKVKKISKDEIVITIGLETLEADIDIAADLIKRASKALDELPVTNFAESKRLIRLQEKLDSLLAV